MALGLFDTSDPRRLPHPPIPLAVYLVVEDAIRCAWTLMNRRPRMNLILHEDPITAELWECLLNDVFNRGLVPGFDTSLLMTPTRESKVSNYDGTKIDLMPDLLIGLQSRTGIAFRSQDWLFVECKPVQVGRAAGAHYCDKGIIRFARGDYAWAMTSALMVGYAAKKYRIAPKLNAALGLRATIETTVFPHKCAHSRASDSSEVTHISEHRRTFCYTQTNQKAPSISLRHLWLKRPTPRAS